MEKVMEKTERIAVIDLGSNSVRLVIADVMGEPPFGHFSVVFELKETVRLGQDMARDGFLKQVRVAQAVKTLKMFRKLCDSYKVDKVFPVATNAVRRAKNQKSFLEEVTNVCGFKFKVLDETEEATNIYRGVVNSIDIPKGVIMDVSGSSTQLICYNRRNILFRENLPFGTITLSDMYNDPNVSAAEQARNIEAYVTDQFERIEWLKTLDPDFRFIGVGGTFRNIAKINRMIERYPLDMIHNRVISEEAFNTVYERVTSNEADKRAKIRGLSVERADIFVSALACVRSFLDCSPFEDIIISGSGIREGIMFGHAVPSTLEKPVSDVMGHSLRTKMLYYGVDKEHAEQVNNLSIQLYKQLRVLHKLPRVYVRILRIASLLHDSGERVKFYDYSKHSFYFIMNSNLYGATHREIILASFVARHQAYDDFSMAEWNRYKSIIRDEDLIAVMKLSVILRIAESLDCSKTSSIKTLTCDVLGDSVIMKTMGEGDCSLEIKNALTVGSDFAKAFKKNLEIL